MQILIDYHYKFWYRINLYSIVLPSVCQVIIFWFWSNIVLAIKMRNLEIAEITQDSFSFARELGGKGGGGVGGGGSKSGTTSSGISESGTSIGSDGDGGFGTEDYGMNLGDADGYCMVVLSLITVYLLMYDVTILAN